MPVIPEWGRWRQGELWGSLFTGTRLCGKFLICKRFYLKTRKEERKENEGKEKRKGKEGSGYLRKNNILKYPLSSTLKTQKCTCTHTHMYIFIQMYAHVCTYVQTHTQKKKKLNFSHLWLHSKVQDSRGYLRPCFSKKEKGTLLF